MIFEIDIDFFIVFHLYFLLICKLIYFLHTKSQLSRVLLSPKNSQLYMFNEFEKLIIDDNKIRILLFSELL